jgi:ferric-dicitrate binding protein FerR (iron transport regulator)
MPGQDNTREFDRIVERLRADDPTFANRVEKATSDADETAHLNADPAADPFSVPRKPRRKLRAGLLGAAALFAMILGGWTGLIIAIVITIWAVRLIMADRDA